MSTILVTTIVGRFLEIVGSFIPIYCESRDELIKCENRRKWQERVVCSFYLEVYRRDYDLNMFSNTTKETMTRHLEISCISDL